MGWRRVKLDQLGKVERGRSRHRPRDDPKLYGGPHPFIQTGDVKASGFRITQFRQTYSTAGLEQSRLWPAGTLCITIAANICDTAILAFPACFPDSIVGFTPYSGVSDVAFVKYALDLVKQQFTAISRGATQDNLSLEKLLSQELSVPDVEEQRRIASILGAYDELIEVNRRRIAVLEAMPRDLFEEWFVRFRFPGHEGLEIVESCDGMSPAGWRIGTAGDIIDFDPRTKVSPTGEKPFIDMGSLDTASSIISGFTWRSGNSGSKFRNGDTLFARITPCLQNGKTGIVRDLPSEDGIGFGSTEFIVMRPGRAGRAFIYCLARYEGFRSHAEAGMAGASGRQRARTDSVASFPISIAAGDSEVYDAFERVAWPMLQLVGELGSANGRLAAARDLLLHRLISGELSVAAAERELEDAV